MTGEVTTIEVDTTVVVTAVGMMVVTRTETGDTRIEMVVIKDVEATMTVDVEATITMGTEEDSKVHLGKISLCS